MALVYGVAIGVSSVPGALLLRRGIEGDLAHALSLFAAGSVAAAFIAVVVVETVGPRLLPSARLALALLLLILLTSGGQHLAFFVDYAANYAAFGDPMLSAGWFRSMASAFAGSGYYYIAIGLPMMLPAGLPVLFAAAFLLMRATR